MHVKAGIRLSTQDQKREKLKAGKLNRFGKDLLVWERVVNTQLKKKVERCGERLDMEMSQNHSILETGERECACRQSSPLPSLLVLLVNVYHEQTMIIF